MAFDQILDVISSRLQCRDAIVFSTLSKHTYASHRPISIYAKLDTSRDITSFARWMRCNGRSIETIHLNSDHQASYALLFACFASEKLVDATLNLQSIDPFAFTFLPNLETLSLSLSRSARDSLSLEDIEFSKLRRLSILSGSLTHVTLPPHLPCLTSLELSRVRTPRLPTILPDILRLSLPRCELNEDLVSQMSSLTTLTCLNVLGCHLSHAPHEFLYLTRLVDLNLSKNSLVNYDTQGAFVDDTLLSIERLPHLTHLDLSHNYIDDMGMEDALPKLECPKLVSLDIACNPCTDLPRGSYLRRLTCLRASFIPVTLSHAASLRDLKLHGYCSKHNPDEILPLNVSNVSPPPLLETIVIDDSHVSARHMNDVLLLVKNKPTLSMYFSMLS